MIARLTSLVVAVVALCSATALAVTPTAAEPIDADASAATASYVAVTPCRLLDTRDTGSAVAANQVLTIDVADTCGVPAAATSVAITLTVANTSAPGFLTAYPAHLAQPGVSNLNWG